jgi:hypothetical protein
LTHTRRRWLIAGTLLAALFIVSYAAAAPRYAHAPTRISIKSTPIDSFSNSDPSKTRFGALEFRGGLVLTSSDKTFGGLSSLHVDADGAHFLSGTDNGSWLRGRIVYRDGRPAAIADAEIAPMLSANGRPLAARGWFDAESLASDGAGHFYVGLERVQKIVRFDYRRLGLRARSADSAAVRFQDPHLQSKPGMPGGSAQRRAACR